MGEISSGMMDYLRSKNEFLKSLESSMKNLRVSK